MSLLSRFPYDEAYAPLVYYSIYLNHQKAENYQEAEMTKKALLKNFPNSIYASILTNPNFQKALVAKTNKTEQSEDKISGLPGPIPTA